MSRSTVSRDGNRRTDIMAGPWRKSSYSASDCVEVAFVDDMVGVRDSKQPTGSVLTVDRPAWATFVDALRRGAFDRA